MASLYEIDNAIANFVPEVDEFTGELLNADILDRLNMERGTKMILSCMNTLHGRKNK